MEHEERVVLSGRCGTVANPKKENRGASETVRALREAYATVAEELRLVYLFNILLTRHSNGRSWFEREWRKLRG